LLTLARHFFRFPFPFNRSGVELAFRVPRVWLPG